MGDAFQLHPSCLTARCLPSRGPHRHYQAQFLTLKQSGFCVLYPRLFSSNADAWTQAGCVSPSQTVAGTKDVPRPLFPSPLSSGEQEVLLWVPDKTQRSTHPEASPPHVVYSRHSETPGLPHALFVASVALLLPCDPCYLTW